MAETRRLNRPMARMSFLGSLKVGHKRRGKRTIGQIFTPTASARDGRALLGWVIVIGAGLRISMLSSAPILEDDYYRYLWDGAVVVNGLNPYAYSPAEVLRAWFRNLQPFLYS